MQTTYSYMKFFEKMWEKEDRVYTFRATDRKEALIWQERLRGALWDLLGMPVLQKYVSDRQDTCGIPRLLESVQEEGYIRYKYEMETLPDVWMPYYVLVPEQTNGEAILALHAHGADKNTVCHVAETEAEAAKIQKTPAECYGEAFVRKGYVVFAPDLPGFGERQEKVSGEKGSLGCSCSDLAEIAEAFGFSMQALALWDLMHLLDVAEKWSDVKKIGCAGFSGGGMYTMWLAAMDKRIDFAVISGYIHSFGDSILRCHRCACNFAPQLWQLCDISDICGLIAPRPLYAENGKQDRQNGRRGVDGPREEFEKVRRIYQIFQAENQLCYKNPEGMHQWYGECVEFMDQEELL